MLLFHTPTVVKGLIIVGFSLFPLLCVQKMQMPYLGGTAKFGRDGDMCDILVNLGGEDGIVITEVLLLRNCLF